MSVIERINNELVKLAIPRQLIPPDPVNYIPWTALTIFLSSLASERCVWVYNDDSEYADGLFVFQTSCGEQMMFEKPIGLHDKTCLCGKPIDVKEADNG